MTKYYLHKSDTETIAIEVVTNELGLKECEIIGYSFNKDIHYPINVFYDCVVYYPYQFNTFLESNDYKECSQEEYFRVCNKRAVLQEEINRLKERFF